MSSEIHTKRLILRAFRTSDAPRVAQLIGDLDVSKWLTHVPHPYTEDDALTFFERPGTAEKSRAITLDGDVIGGIALENELGYWLGKPYWGQGFGSEAARALVDSHFSTSTDDIWSGYIVGNTASSRLLARLGFENSHFEELQSVSLKRTVMIQKMRLSGTDWARAS